MEVIGRERVGGAVICGLAAKATVLAALLVTGCQVAGEGEEVAAEPRSPLDRRVEALVSEIGLDDGQRQRLEAVRDLVEERREALRADRAEAFEHHLASLESGEVDAAELHATIDAKLDELRQTIHQVADELIALVGTMDQDQRQRAATKLRTFHERLEVLHEGLESADGQGALLEHLRERICSDEP